jgi:hypothetical protein
LKFEIKIISEKINTTMWKTREIPFINFRCKISGRYFDIKISRNITLKELLNPARFSGELLNPT